MNKKIIPPMSRVDKLCLLSLAGLLAAVVIGYEAIDGAAIRAAEKEDKPPVVEIVPPADCTPIVEAVIEAQEVAQEPFEADPYDETIPLDRELQAVLREACEANGVCLCDALGLIEIESNFQADADNGLCYGLCQLNRDWFPDDLTPAENIRAGVAYLGELLERYNGDTAAALTAYNRGNYSGTVSQYAKNVLRESEKWGNG